MNTTQSYLQTSKIIILARPLVSQTSNRSISDLLRIYPNKVLTDFHSKKVIDDCLLQGRYPQVERLDVLVSLLISDYNIPLFVYCPSVTNSTSKNPNQFIQTLLTELDKLERPYTILN